MHPNNKHQGQYPLEELILLFPPLKPFVTVNAFNLASINFFDPLAVKMLNKALLNYYYQLENWDIPEHYLCPPIPGRADYIHYMAALLAEEDRGKEKIQRAVQCLDIGLGANCIYPIIGVHEYGWNFVGSEIDEKAMKNAQKIIDSNASLSGKIELRRQKEKEHIFRGIIGTEELFDLCLCNPPFHSSAEEAAKGSWRKINNLRKGKGQRLPLNFGGQAHELWCRGGEKFFVSQMIEESASYARQVKWFSSLVSKEEHLQLFYKLLKSRGAKKVRTLEMSQGNKRSRILAWTFGA